MAKYKSAYAGKLVIGGESLADTDTIELTDDQAGSSGIAAMIRQGKLVKSGGRPSKKDDDE